MKNNSIELKYKLGVSIMEKDLLLDLMDEINEEVIEDSIVGGKMTSILEPVETTIRYGCCYYCQMDPILRPEDMKHL